MVKGAALPPDPFSESPPRLKALLVLSIPATTSPFVAFNRIAPMLPALPLAVPETLPPRLVMKPEMLMLDPVIEIAPPLPATDPTVVASAPRDPTPVTRLGSVLKAPMVTAPVVEMVIVPDVVATV